MRQLWPLIATGCSGRIPTHVSGAGGCARLCNVAARQMLDIVAGQLAACRTIPGGAVVCGFELL